MSLPHEPVSTRSLGAIHGRFQPFHNGHMAYLEAALNKCQTVIVGITNPSVPGTHVDEVTDPLRHLPENNPFSYFERLEMIVESCVAISREILERVRIVPFDVTGPRRMWRNVVPLDAVQFVVPHDPWDNEKAQRFAAYGYDVDLLATVPNRLSATRVRALLRDDDPSWQRLVPSGCATVLRRLDCQRRLQQGAEAN